MAVGTIIRLREFGADVAEVLAKHDGRTQCRSFSAVYDAWRQVGELDSCQIAVLQAFRDRCGLLDGDVKWNERILPYVYASSIRERRALPIADVSGLNPPPILKPNEVVHAAIPAVLKEPKTVRVGYSPGSRGVSLRIAKGVSYRVGAHRGHAITEVQMLRTSEGELLITNQRLFLLPSPGNKPLNLPLKDLLSYHSYSDGMEVYKSGREKPYFIQVWNGWQSDIAAMCLGYLTGGYDG